MLPRLAFLSKTLPTHSKNVLNMIKLRFSVQKKGCGREATEKRKAKTINYHYPDISWNSRCLVLWNFNTKLSPLFSTDFQLSTRMSIFRKQTRKQKNLLSYLPLAKYLDFYDASKNSEPIKTFWEARLKSHPPKFKSLTFLNRES
jgi:hypothetical protein